MNYSRYNTVTTRKPHYCFKWGKNFQLSCKIISATYWKNQHFEIVKPVEHVESAKKELDRKNRELIQLNYYYLDGKNDAYEYTIKHFEKGV